MTVNAADQKFSVKKGFFETNLFRFLICFSIGAFFWVCPHSDAIDPKAWKIFSVFVFTLSAMIVKPLATGAVTLMSLVVLVFSNVLTFGEAFSGFSNDIVWLIAGAFFIARGFIETGLGLRIAYFIMSFVGKSTLGMAYGLAITDWILGAAIPSVTARAGGVVYPVVTSLAKAFGSDSKSSPRKIGAYLVQSAFQCGAVTSAMFLTAMAGNPMVQSLAETANVQITWSSWMLAALVPGLVSLLLIPLLLYKIYPPEIKNTPKAKLFAQEKLREMGRMSQKEYLMMGAFLFMIIFWCFAPVFKLSPTIIALMGLLFLIITDVLSWEDVLKEKGAWDTLIWFASLLTLATFLSKFGFMQWFSSVVESHIHGVSWTYGFSLLALLYFYAHYFFASNIAHITTMYAPFLLLSIALGTPPALAALVLGFFSCLFGALTTYGCGPAPIFYGSGYVTTSHWWKLGFIVSVLNIVIWAVVGGLWWYALGLFTLH